LWYELYRSAIRNNWLLVDTIGETQDVCVVIDSSKDSLRLRLLYQHRPDSVYAILLVRDLRAIAYSAQKRGVDPIDAINTWKGYYDRALATLRQMNKLPVMRVQYEALCEDPVAMRRRIARFLGLADPGPSLQDSGRGPHLVAGNPMRYRWTGEVRLDDAWTREFTGEARKRAEEYHARLGHDWPHLDANGRD
jgi:hypothetical protein